MNQAGQISGAVILNGQLQPRAVLKICGYLFQGAETPVLAINYEVRPGFVPRRMVVSATLE